MESTVSDDRVLTLSFEDASVSHAMCGASDINIREIEEMLGVQVLVRGNEVRIYGDPSPARRAAETLRQLYHAYEERRPVGHEEVDAIIYGRGQDTIPAGNVAGAGAAEAETPVAAPAADAGVISTFRGRVVKARTANQQAYVHAIERNPVTFGIGPAGTGKTYLAVAMAVRAYFDRTVDRIILTRPAVEAGERLGFLPGALEEKINPYLRPLYDALYDIVAAEKVARLIDQRIIEVAPLAFMRGRTLSRAFVILDEAQNTTRQQMMMFLTRIGAGSKTVVTGDLTQTDLPLHLESGLAEVREILEGLEGTALIEFDNRDVVRHPIVARILERYASRRPR